MTQIQTGPANGESPSLRRETYAEDLRKSTPLNIELLASFFVRAGDLALEKPSPTLWGSAGSPDGRIKQPAVFEQSSKSEAFD
jgi:hypothetical protein